MHLKFSCHRFSINPSLFLLLFVVQQTWSREVRDDERTRERNGQKGCSAPSIDNGMFVVVNITAHDRYPENTLVVFSCDLGYRLVGDHYNHCLRKRGEYQWYPLLPVCIPTKEAAFGKECTNPPLFDHLEFRGTRDKYPVSAVVVYQCRHGLHLRGQNVLTCAQDGTWQPSEPPSCATPPVDPPDGSGETTTDAPTRKESINTLIINIILYVAVGLLLMFGFAIAYNVRTRWRQRKLRNPHRQSRFRWSATGLSSSTVPADHPGTYQSVGYQSTVVPSAPLLDADFHPGQSAAHPSAPSAGSIFPPGFSRVSATSSGDELPPSYDEATSMQPPSFQVAQQLPRTPQINRHPVFKT